MKYRELINFDPIETVIKLRDADKDEKEEQSLVSSYVMSDDMADKINAVMLSQLQLDEVVDNKGVLLVGNYGTGKSHLMSLISSVAKNASYLESVRNKKFAGYAESIAGRFEILRIEIGAVETSLRDIILGEVQEDFSRRFVQFEFPSAKEGANNKKTFEKMMEAFAERYPDKGYLIVVDEFLDYLGSRKDQQIKLDLGFMRELGEFAGKSKLRVIFGVQEMLFENKKFSFVADSLNRVKDRFEQLVIQKEDSAFVVIERILKKSDKQKAVIRDHLQKFSGLYTNMSSHMEEFVDLFPIHPAYIEVLNKSYIVEKRHILRNISEVIRKNLDDELTDDTPGIISFDEYWSFIKNDMALRTYENIKEVVDKSRSLEEILAKSFPKKTYKKLAMQIIYALSVHRLTTIDITIRAGLTSENLRDDLCLYLPNMPDQSSDTLLGIIQQTMKDVMTTVSGQFIEHNDENGQYYLDLKKDVDYDERINQRATLVGDDELNRYYFDLIYSCLNWDGKEHNINTRIYEHTLNWLSHKIYRVGYLFLGTPESRPTTYPPEDYYIYFIPPFGTESYTDEKKEDEVFFVFKQNNAFKNELKLYAAARTLQETSDVKNQGAYEEKARRIEGRLKRQINDNRFAWYEVIYKGQRRPLLEVIKAYSRTNDPFKETLDLVASVCLDAYFEKKYPHFPKFRTQITGGKDGNIFENVKAGLSAFGGGKLTIQAKDMLESFGLLDGENISVVNSPWAQHFIKRIKTLPHGAVLNYNDIYADKRMQDSVEQFDRQFGISNTMLYLVFLAMVRSGHAVFETRSSGPITASNLEGAPKLPIKELWEFKHVSRPKDMPLAELTKLFDILGLAPGLINNPADRDDGVRQLVAKANEIVKNAVYATSKLGQSFELWGEPLIRENIAASYRDALKRISETFGNFQQKYNTVAKLNNFQLTEADIDSIARDIRALKVVAEYDRFKTDCVDIVNYISNIDAIDLPNALREELDEARKKFEAIREGVAKDLNGTSAASEVVHLLESVKQHYIDFYMEEHKRHRLDFKAAQKRGKIMESQQFVNLKQLAALTQIFQTKKLEDEGKHLVSLTVCTELTPDMMRKTHICPKCRYTLGSSDVLVHGQLDAIAGRLESIEAEWTATLLKTLSDPVLEKKFLKPDEQEVIDKFLKSKKLPDVVDKFFVDSAKKLIEGFESVEIEADDLLDEIGRLGPCNEDDFIESIKKIVGKRTKGHDAKKLRIVLKR